MGPISMRKKITNLDAEIESMTGEKRYLEYCLDLMMNMPTDDEGHLIICEYPVMSKEQFLKET